MIQMIQSEPGRNTVGKGPGTLRKGWVFTLKAQNYAHSEVIQMILGLGVTKYRFQKEKGEETGYVHYQGVFSLTKKARKTKLVKMIPAEMHIEPAKNWFAAWNYAGKVETRLEVLQEDGHEVSV